MTTIVVKNPHSRKLERYDIGGLTPEELQALPLDDRVCEAVAAAVAPCLPEEFLAAYVVRVGVVEAGHTIISAWIARRLRDLFSPIPGAWFHRPDKLSRPHKVAKAIEADAVFLHLTAKLPRETELRRC